MLFLIDGIETKIKQDFYVSECDKTNVIRRPWHIFFFVDFGSLTVGCIHFYTKFCVGFVRLNTLYILNTKCSFSFICVLCLCMAMDINGVPQVIIMKYYMFFILFEHEIIIHKTFYVYK